MKFSDEVEESLKIITDKDGKEILRIELESGYGLERQFPAQAAIWLTEDGCLKCEAGVTCFNRTVGLTLVGDYDNPSWTYTILIAAPGDPRYYVLCEDCDGWLQEVYGTKEN